MIDVFREVRERVTAEDVARHYGIEIDRHGKALCPFHRDRHPSMTFRHGRYRCWSCQASGSSIDLTAHLLSLDALGAVRELNHAFALCLPVDRPPTATENLEGKRRQEIAEQHIAFETWRNGFINALTVAIREGNTLEITDLDKLTEREATALRMNATFEYWADTLMYGTLADQAQIYRERRQIGRWIGRVLSN